jgi:serine protease Do
MVDFIVSLLFVVALGAGDFDAKESDAFRSAVNHVGPSVVRIELIGAETTGDKVEFGAAPFTGLIVDPQGYILTVSLPFDSKPESILVQLPSRERKSAQLVAIDRLRKVVLLKIETDRPLPVPEAVEREKIQVGQRAIAVGRVFDSLGPNISVGIISATNRIGGKAIQTDAAVGPNNYGGPLIDLSGKVFGILIPLSPGSEMLPQGIDLYDSGIGFAVAYTDLIEKVLPRLREGNDLQPGMMGVGFGNSDPNLAAPVIGTVQPGSPAQKAGLEPGDQVVVVEGKPVGRLADFINCLGTFYSGDLVKLTILRGAKEKTVSLRLAEKKIN